MKRYLLILGCFSILTACSNSSDKGQAHPPAAPDKISLAHYSWQLQDARNAQDIRIDTLFVQTNRPVQLNFDDRRVSVGNTCNIMNGEYSLDENRITFGIFAATMKMCIESGIAALDGEISRLLKGTNTYSVTEAEHPILVFTTPDGDTLKFIGAQTPAARYGGDGETIFLEVAPETVSCSDPSLLEKRCLRVRRIYYDDNGIKTGVPDSWQDFYQDIEGYNFQPGIRNVLRVKRYSDANLPADAVFILDIVVESEIVNSGGV